MPLFPPRRISVEGMDSHILCIHNLKLIDNVTVSYSVVDSQKALGSKKIDLFQSARVDPTRPIEEAIANLKVLVEEGLIDHIGISEAKADTVRRANTVSYSHVLPYLC